MFGFPYQDRFTQKRSQLIYFETVTWRDFKLVITREIGIRRKSIRVC